MKCEYSIIDKEKEQLFAKLLPEYYLTEDMDTDTMAIGALDEGKPCAAIILRNKGMDNTMKIDHLAVSEAYRRMNIGSVLLHNAKKSAKAQGFHKFEFDYPYEMAGDLAAFLRKNGFKEAEILGITYELSKDVLGEFLKNDYDARHMKQSYIEEEKEAEIKNLTELPTEVRDYFKELHPIGELSSVVLHDGQISAYSIVSHYEKSFFISSIYTTDGKLNLISALIYRSMGIVYMNLEDDETMVFTGYKKQNRELLSFLFDPILDYGIKRNIVMRSVIRL